MNFKDRNIQLCKQLVDKLQIDLRGLKVGLECASGAYSYMPVMALISGAEVLSIGQDSSYGKFENNISKIDNIINSNIYNKKISYVHRTNLKNNPLLKELNILTNSGMIRPINSEIINQLPPYCVIPLMWETWEFRNQDIDISSCIKKSIPVIGTNEDFESVKMFGYNSFIVLKLLFDLNIEGYNNRILLLGGGKSGSAAYFGLSKMGITIDWLSADKSKHSLDYDEIKYLLKNNFYDAVINFEHINKNKIIGKNGFISFYDFLSNNKSIVYGHICGNIDVNELESCGIKYLPNKISPFGYMSYETTNLGSRPVIELSALGLKVGQIAANERLNGKSVFDTIKTTVDFGVGQDFEGGFLNFKINKYD